MDKSLERMPNETRDQYFYRICNMKDSLGFTWPQMAEIFNNEFGCNKGDTAYRKDWAAFERIFNANADKLIGDNNYLDEIREATNELYKVKKQLSDQRREYNKVLAYDARAEHLTEKLIEAANLVPLVDYSNVFTYRRPPTNEEALLCLSDWHFGQVSNNIWNKYNIDICKQRVEKLYNDVVSALRNHRVKTLHMAIFGDMINVLP